MESNNVNNIKMKKIFVFVISILLINYSSAFCKISSNRTEPPVDSIRILTTPDLLSLSTKWVAEYKKVNPESGIRLISVPDEKIAEKLVANGYIGFVTNDNYSGLKSQSYWRAVVGRDVIVPVINAKNPFIAELNKKGVSPRALAEFFNNMDSGSWGKLIGTNQNFPVNYYYFKDQSINSGLAEFLKTGTRNLKGKEVNTAEELISAIQKDPYALGFCKMINIFDLENQKMSDNISLLPIDRNSNGIIDYNEKIYDDPTAFSRGVYIGKYPKTLISNIYSVSLAQPENTSAVAFLKWILTDGQKFLYTSGYSDLLISERQTTMEKLHNAKIYSAIDKSDGSFSRIFLMILVFLIVAVISTEGILRFIRRRKATSGIATPGTQSILNESNLVIPKGIYFDKTHTWAFLEQNGIAKVGIDDFLQHLTGNITRIKLLNKGEKVKKGQMILSIIQNGKQLNLYSPITGVILEQNKLLEANSSLINSSPYTEGWIYKIEPTNWHRENQLLFMAEKHLEFIKTEFTRLKDFLAVVLNANSEKYGLVILQDGGELKDGILSNMGPEVWEDFQTKFIDPSRQLWFYEIF
jgi:glycine cleavage system H lipoate-binding protein/ABC-type phosphate transport system substrate-binding protein